jgi:hypothetical protein
MMQKFNVATILVAGFVLAACDGDNGLNGNDGTDGADGVDGLNSLVATRDIPRGDAVCLGGGLALDSGLDTNRDGVLDPAEVTATELLECAATPQVRALHASPDAPPVNIWVNGAPALTDVDYGVGSGFIPGVEEVNVQVEAIIPGGNAVVIDADLSLDYSTDYTIIAVDNVAGPVRPLVIANPSDELLAPGSFFAQVVHASPSAPPVDVYVTAFNADLTTSSPVNAAPLAFEQFTPRLEVPAGDYQLRVTLAGDPATVVYDSGEISLAAGADLLIAALENVGLGDSAVQLVALDGAGSATLFDAATPAAAVAVHLSPDAPAVDILADIDATANDEALRLATNIAFTEFCAIDGIPAPDAYTLSVVANADNSVVALQFPFAATVDGAATAIVSGFLSSGTPAITALPLGVDPRSVITEARLRLTHASPSTGDVDIYLLAAGTDLDDPSVTPNFAAVPFGVDTGVLSIGAGTYDVYVTPAGDKSVRAIEVPGIALTGGEVWDVIARDPAADGSEGPLPLPLIIDYDAVADCT